ncbi:PLP-dependent aminotransferase family protein [Rothia sp. CCM 9419]|uniref:MocR-like pyridoxine biosynthesis transcription factor PdxR n=1 Tax=Rothia sp. CCM 9419 TaxID=3402662 RepID=UPI003ADCAFF0
MHTSASVELPITLNRNLTTSLPSQLAEKIRELILNGTLIASDPLPSTRTLAQRLNVSRGTIVSAYEQLTAEGYLHTTHTGTTINPHLPHPHNKHHTNTPQPTTPTHLSTSHLRTPQNTIIDLRPGTPDTSTLASTPWRAAWRTAAANVGTTYPATGSPTLKKELAEHLRITRNVITHPEELLITSGARDGFRLTLSTLRTIIKDRPLRIAVENPGYPSLQKIPATFGHTIMPIPLDTQGLNPQHLPPHTPPDIILLAPSHQYPLGTTMPITRRLELLEWAHKNKALIVEDDYDSELRYTGDPVPALASLTRSHHLASHYDCVVTLGSFAKTLSPAVGLGYLLTPQHLHEPLSTLRTQLGSPVSAITQEAMTLLLQNGTVRRHIAKMRRTYATRRRLVQNYYDHSKLSQQCTLLPMDGGLHAILKFTSRAHLSAEEQYLKEQKVVARAKEQGVSVRSLGEYWSHNGMPRQDYGLIIGFGAVSERYLEQAMTLLTRIICNP